MGLDLRALTEASAAYSKLQTQAPAFDLQLRPE